MKSKAYKLKVFDAQTAGKVIVGLEDVGISNVSLKLQLKSKAVSKAKSQAEYLVKPLNQKVTKALFITDKYYQGRDYDGELNEIVVMGYSAKRSKEEYKPIEIEFKPIKVETEVTIRFAIE